MRAEAGELFFPVEVFVNCVHYRCVKAADTEQGWAIVYVMNGKWVTVQNGKPVEKLVTGEVEIVPTWRKDA